MSNSKQKKNASQKKDTSKKNSSKIEGLKFGKKINIRYEYRNGEKIPVACDGHGKPIKLPQRPQSKFDLATALKLRYENGLSYNLIAKFLNVAPMAVYKQLKRFENLIHDSETINNFKEKRTDILTGLELTLLAWMAKEDKLKNATVNQIAYAFQQVFNARRLEEQKATSITDIQHFDAVLDELRGKIIDITPLAKEVNIPTPDGTEDISFKYIADDEKQLEEIIKKISEEDDKAD